MLELVRTKNGSSVLTVNTMIYAVASMAFLLVGYSLAFVLWENSSLIGSIGGALVVFGVPIFDRLKLDDPVGALSVHLVNGI